MITQKRTEFFGKYEKGRKVKLNRTDYFRYGYSYYKQQDYKAAIPRFSEIIGKTKNGFA